MMTILDGKQINKLQSISIGITGINGFIGTHLSNWLRYVYNCDKIIPISKDDFDSHKVLEKKIKECQVVIHLAAINRSDDQKKLFEENKIISDKLTECLKNLEALPRLIFVSSIHEGKQSAFGQSKHYTRKGLEKLYRKSNKLLTFITPNVFGPFCKPNYNSVIATFSSNLINNKNCLIENDRNLDLIYIDDLISLLLDKVCEKEFLKDNVANDDFPINTFSVKEIFNKLSNFHNSYIRKSIIPEITKQFDLNLFHTFRSYIPYESYSKNVTLKIDERGYFAELIKSKSQGQISISESTTPIERGNHFHTRKMERFIVLKGRIKVELRRIDKNDIQTFILDSKNHQFIDIPIWHTHNLTNYSADENSLVLFWINEFFDLKDSDTYPLIVNKNEKN